MLDKTTLLGPGITHRTLHVTYAARPAPTAPHGVEDPDDSTGGRGRALRESIFAEYA